MRVDQISGPIFEAKGGTSKLGTSRLKIPAWPTNNGGWQYAPSAAPLAGGRYLQMGKDWLRWWITHKIVKNLYTTARNELINAFDSGDPFVTGVVSVNLNRNPEFKLALQVFVSKTGSGFNHCSVAAGYNLSEFV